MNLEFYEQLVVTITNHVLGTDVAEPFTQFTTEDFLVSYLSSMQFMCFAENMSTHGVKSIILKLWFNDDMIETGYFNVNKEDKVLSKKNTRFYELADPNVFDRILDDFQENLSKYKDGRLLST